MHSSSTTLCNTVLVRLGTLKNMLATLHQLLHQPTAPGSGGGGGSEVCRASVIRERRGSTRP